MVILSVLLVVVAVVAVSAFSLLLILARRFRDLEERVNMFLPISVGRLPAPGTAVAPFEAVTTGGRTVSDQDFRSGERIFALLTTGCGDCSTVARVLREHAGDLESPALVGVIGPEQDRVAIVAELGEHVQVLEEAAFGPVASALEIDEFPTILLIRDGYIQFAEHAVEPVLAKLTNPITVGSSR